jgi:cyclic 2,3-diphosphoglycerate synthetase
VGPGSGNTGQGALDLQLEIRGAIGGLQALSHASEHIPERSAALVFGSGLSASERRQAVDPAARLLELGSGWASPARQVETDLPAVRPECLLRPGDLGPLACGKALGLRLSVAAAGGERGRQADQRESDYATSQPPPLVLSRYPYHHGVRLVALIDGEHHPPVVRDALDRLASEHELAAILFVGGEEKVAEAVLGEPASHYGRPVAIADGDPEAALREQLAALEPDAVIDLSGEPVLEGGRRHRLASIALHHGARYRAPGLELSPPTFERLPFNGPVLAVIGTGKRTGKTAVAGHYARLLREHAVEPVILAMGRGGPREPQLVRADERPDLDGLREIVRTGGHAASDYLEDAVLAGVSCVGCRRCGEGPAGEPFESNVSEGARLALSVEPEVLLLEGSGAALPPIEAHRTVCVTNAALAGRQALSYLGPYRLLRSDLVLIVGAERLSRHELGELKQALGEWCEHQPLIGCRLEPEPAGTVPAGARVALFTTASAEHEPALREALAGHGADLSVFSPNLAKRAELRRDLERAASERCDLYLTELKAAAVELVAADAERRGVELTFVRNRPVSLAGEPDLDGELLRLLEQARRAASGPVAAPVQER